MRLPRCTTTPPGRVATLLWCVLVLCAPAAAQAPAAEPPTAADPATPPSGAALAALPTRPLVPTQTAPELLSTAWMQAAVALIADVDVTDEGIESALDLALACGQLTPDRAAPWRLSMYLADQLETSRPDLALKARRAALANLARLEPNNDSVTLARLTDAVESHGTAEERVRAYEQLLDDANAARLGAAVRSRLAYQLAMLVNRMGNTELFARWLGEAVKIDPAFPQATMAAAGFFRTRINDPVADVELLSLAIEANPRNLQAWSALITVLLDNAAFKGAERVCRNALAVAMGDRHWASNNNLTCDLATALWGQGRRDEARQVLNDRLRTITDDYRRMLQFTDATLTAERIRAMYPPLPAGLSLTGLALSKGKVDEAALERLVAQALGLTEAEIALLKQQGLAANLDAMLDKATISLLFRKDPADVAALIAEAAKERLLPEATLARFQGLLDWRKGRLDEALAALGPIRQDDPLAQFGYASALADAGRTADAAREFKSLATTRIGTTLGLMALDQLAPLLKQDALLTAQLDPAIAARARAMDEAVDTHLSRLIDDMMAYPLRMLSVSLATTAESPGPYAWIGVKIKVRNLSRMPLAVGRSDPIVSRLLMRAEIPSSTTGELQKLPPAVIPFDQTLELAPGGQIEFTIDATLTPLGLFLARNPLATHVVSISVLVNPRDTEYGLMPAFMGSVTQLVPFMVSGAAVKPEWVAESLSALAQPPSSTAAFRLVLLAHAAANPDSMPESAREALRAPEVWKAMVSAWGGLEPIEQAWVVAALPPDTAAMAPLLDAIRSSTDPKVLTSWLLTRVTDANDPMLDVARRTGDARLSGLADSMGWLATRRATRAIENLGVGGAGSGVGGTGGAKP